MLLTEKIVTNECMISFYLGSDTTITITTTKVPHIRMTQGPRPEKWKGEDTPQASHGLIHLCSQTALLPWSFG